MVRHRALLLAIATGSTLLLARTAFANASMPSPVPNSTYPAFIRLVGSTAGVPDTAAGKFTVILRDVIHNPIAYGFVVVDFSGCPDIHIASNQLNPNSIVNCALHTVSAFTNSTGTVAFTLLGSSWNAGTYSGAAAARIYAALCLALDESRRSA